MAIGSALVLGATAALATGPPASAATTCSFDAASRVLSIGGTPDVGTGLGVQDNGEIAVAHHFVNGGGLITCLGPTPTTANTDTIQVTHQLPGRTMLTINDPEEFRPGTIDEGILQLDCPDEIEINVNLGGERDVVRLDDFDSSDDRLVLGDDGIDWNPGGFLCADLDIDVSVAFTKSFEIDAGNGANTVTGQGSDQTGDPSFAPITYTGGSGVDTFTGGDGADIVDGEAGKDLLSGGAGDDRLTGGTGPGDRLFGQAGLDGLFAEDGKRDLRLDCGPGANLGEFAVADRRKDPAAKRC